MLEKAQLPPSIEHTYALWLDKSGQTETKVVQPSPFKSQPPVLTTQQPDQRVAVPITLQTKPDGRFSFGISYDNVMGTGELFLHKILTF